MPESDRVQRPATAHQPILGDVDDPIAVGDTRLIEAVSAHKLDLGDVVAYLARDGDAIQAAEDRYRHLTRDDDHGADYRAKVGVPDVTSGDHDKAAPARIAAASSIRVSSLSSGVA